MNRRLQALLLLFLLLLAAPGAPIVAWFRSRGQLHVVLSLLFAIAGAGLALLSVHRRLPLWRGLLAAALFAGTVYGLGIWVHGLRGIRARPEELTHFALFAPIGWLAAGALGPRPRSPLARAALAAVLTAAMGAMHESLQIFLPDRVFDPRDIGANAASGVLGVALHALLHPGSG